MTVKITGKAYKNLSGELISVEDTIEQRGEFYALGLPQFPSNSWSVSATVRDYPVGGAALYLNTLNLNPTRGIRIKTLKNGDPYETPFLGGIHVDEGEKFTVQIQNGGSLNVEWFPRASAERK